MMRLALFAALTAFIAWVSRDSLVNVRSHGFYRFLAWECILGLFFLNFISLQQWFGDFFSTRQVISSFLLVACVVPVVWGTYLLRTQGQADAARRSDGPCLPFEKTTHLVTSGIFGYIRHPLYSSLLLLAWGVFFKRPAWPAGVLALGATAFLIATARTEEVENIRYFGQAYRDYMQHTRMFVPFVF